MKYSTLQNDIINILHSTDYNLYLKLYDKDGNTTINSDDTKWIYINNYNIIISLMDENNPNISIWKGTNSFNENMKKIVQRIRELANLNGVSVDIKVYSNLNQRKIYNLIKYAIQQTNKDDDKMNENHNIDESLYMLINTAHNTKRVADMYLSEDLQNSKSKSILNEMIDEILSLKSCKSLDKKCLNKLYTIKSLSETKEFVKSLDKKTSKILSENISNINNITKYVKNKYTNNVEINKKKPNSLFVLENAKVYMVKENSNKENLINAYNKLISLTDKASSGTDLLRTIKKNHLCEEYDVNKHDLINFWLYESNGQEIPEKKIFVIEDSNGFKSFFNENLKFGIKALAEHINNGGSKEDIIGQNIIKETIKYNDIKDFINTYYTHYSLRNYIKGFKDMLSETITKLTDGFDESLFENVEEDVDYKDSYNEIVKSCGVEHPALKYFAIIETKNRLNYTSILMEQAEKDEDIIFENVRPYTKNVAECADIIQNMIENNVDKIMNENKNITRSNGKEVAEKLFNQLNESANSSPITSALFNIVHSKQPLNNSKIEFLKTIEKYYK